MLTTNVRYLKNVKLFLLLALSFGGNRLMAQTTVTIDSNAGHDGWIQLRGDGSNAIGTSQTDSGGGSDGIRVGDAEWNADLDEAYRSILSFDTSVIPANATITNVDLRMNYTSLTGNVVAAFGQMRAELRTGAFNNNLALENADHTTAASSGAIAFGSAAPTAPTLGINTWNLPGAEGFVNKNGGANSGFTQVRLSFALVTNNNRGFFQTGDDRWNFTSGNDGASANRPRLIVTYTVPTPSPTPSPSPTASPTESPTPSPTESPTPSPTETESPTPSPTESPTESPTPSPSESPTESPTPSPTETESPTPTDTETPTPSPTESETPTPSPTETESPTPSPSPTPNAVRGWQIYS